MSSTTKSLSEVFRAGLTSIAKTAPAGTRPARPGLLGWMGEGFSGAWQRGVAVDPIGGLTAFAAVYSSISLIAGDIAKLRVKVMRRDRRTGTWQEVNSGLPIHDLLRRPNGFQNWGQYATHWLTTKLLYGNAYSAVQVDERDSVVALHMLDPRRVTPLVTPGGDVYYSLGGDDLARMSGGMVLPARNVIHDRHVTLWHPLVGVSPISACGVSATQGIRIQSNSSTFFENMSQPSGMLTAPGTIDDVTAVRLKKEFEANHSGMNLGRLSVLGDGLKYEPVAVPAHDAQLIEQLRWTVEDVARAFRVPLHMLSAGPAPALNNVEALTMAYYGQTLGGLVEAMEQCLDLGFRLPADMRVELDLRGLVRMDTAARFEALGKGVSGGWLSPNEARAMEDLPPVEGGASPMAQQQNFSLAALARRDAQPDPFATRSVGTGFGQLPAGFDLDELKGQDGRDGQEGPPGRDAVHIDILDGIDTAKRYQRGTYAHYRGGIVRSFRATDPLPEDGELEKSGWHVVVRGIAETKVELDSDMRTVKLRQALTDGKVIEDAVRVPTMIHRGVWNQGEVYTKGDATTRDGSTWILLEEEQRGAPGTDGSGWLLGVRRGRDGHDGLRGEKGDRGAEGRAGKDLTQMSPDGRKW